MAKSLMDPRGAVRKWLTTGIELPRMVTEAGGQAVKVGTMKGTEAEEE